MTLEYIFDQLCEDIKPEKKSILITEKNYFTPYVNRLGPFDTICYFNNENDLKSILEKHSGYDFPCILNISAKTGENFQSLFPESRYFFPNSSLIFSDRDPKIQINIKNAEFHQFLFPETYCLFPIIAFKNDIFLDTHLYHLKLWENILEVTSPAYLALGFLSVVTSYKAKRVPFGNKVGYKISEHL